LSTSTYLLKFLCIVHIIFLVVLNADLNRRLVLYCSSFFFCTPKDLRRRAGSPSSYSKKEISLLNGQQIKIRLTVDASNFIESIENSRHNNFSQADLRVCIVPTFFQQVSRACICNTRRNKMIIVIIFSVFHLFTIYNIHTHINCHYLRSQGLNIIFL